MKNNNTCCTHGPHHVDTSIPQSDEDSAEGDSKLSSFVCLCVLGFMCYFER